MKKTKNDQEEFLLLKIKSPKDIDFYSEHKVILDQCGHVDFAKIGNSILKMDHFCSGDTIFIKESIANGGSLYSATLETVIEKGEDYPAYYDAFITNNVFWLRLSSIVRLKNPDYLEDYETRAGGSVKSALKSMSPNFYIRRKGKN